MFWSLVLEPSKRYSSIVKETFHLSMAAVDLKTAKNDNDTYPVLIEVDGQELVLCNLSKSRSPHANLDLVFETGTDITFSTSGKATIHLTGYLTGDDNLDSDQDSDVDVESYSSSEEGESLNAFMSGSKNDKLPKGLKEVKKSAQQSPVKRKLEQAEAGSKKKPKVKPVDDDDDSSNDLDENALGKLVESLNKDGSDSDLEDESDDEDVDSDLLDSDGSLEDDSEDESAEDSEDEKPKPQKTPKNKKDASLQKTPQNKTPVSTKKDKNKQLNGITPGTGKKDKNQTPKPDQKTPKNKDQKGNQTPPSQKNANTPQSQKKQTLPGGVTIEELKPGNGPVAKSGKMVAVYYTGRLKNNNRVFDQSNQGPGFKFRLGNSEVIKGWDVGLNGMKVGSKRRITCPPAMAYGNKGSPPQIPPNSWLVFDVELKSVN